MKELKIIRELLQDAGDPAVIEALEAAEDKINRAYGFLYGQESGVATVILKILDPAQEAKPKEPESEPDFYHIFGKPEGGIKRKIGSCIEDMLNAEQTRLKREIEEAEPDGRKWRVWAELKRRNGKIVS